MKLVLLLIFDIAAILAVVVNRAIVATDFFTTHSRFEGASKVILLRQMRNSPEGVNRGGNLTYAKLRRRPSYDLQRRCDLCLCDLILSEMKST